MKVSPDVPIASMLLRSLPLRLEKSYAVDAPTVSNAGLTPARSPSEVGGVLARRARHDHRGGRHGRQAAVRRGRALSSRRGAAPDLGQSRVISGNLG